MLLRKRGVSRVGVAVWWCRNLFPQQPSVSIAKFLAVPATGTGTSSELSLLP